MSSLFFLPWSVSTELRHSMATNLGAAGPHLPPPSLPPSLPLLVCKRSIVWNIDIVLQYRTKCGPHRWVQITGSSPCPRPAACSPVALVMSLWDTYTWLLVSAVAMRTLTFCAIYGNPWGRQEGGREWESFSATLQLVCCSKTTRGFWLLGWLGLHQLFRWCHVFI